MRALNWVPIMPAEARINAKESFCRPSVCTVAGLSAFRPALFMPYNTRYILYMFYIYVICFIYTQITATISDVFTSNNIRYTLYIRESQQ